MSDTNIYDKKEKNSKGIKIVIIVGGLLILNGGVVST